MVRADDNRHLKIDGWVDVCNISGMKMIILLISSILLVNLTCANTESKQTETEKEQSGFFNYLKNLSSNRLGNISTFEKNKYGFLEKNGSIRPAQNSGKFDIFVRNKYGFEKKAGSYRSSVNGSNLDIYSRNKYGFEEKTGSIRKGYNDKLEIFEKNKYGFEEKVGSLRKNSSGGYDVFRKNKYGFEQKVGAYKP